MGHIDLHLLPSTPPWRRVVGLLETVTPNPADVAAATADAAHDRLIRLGADPNVIYCVWLLVRLASAARRPDFDEAIAQLGLDPQRSSSVVGLLTQVSARVRAELERQPGSGPFGELAMQALGRTLSETIGAQGVPLFTSSLEDVARAFHRVTTSGQLGQLLARFFGEFLARVLRFYVDRALPLQIGPEGGFASIQQSELFVADLTNYARVIASTSHAFAADWFSLHDWQAEGAISRDEVGAFVAHTFDKVQFALRREGAAA